MGNRNRKIAKNTLLLYVRMLLTMGVSLFTVRVVLDTLGAVDYGLYSVVGGIVTMFSFLTGTLASASQRYFSYELGRNDYVQLKKTFSVTMTIYILMGLLILILAETVGLWFLNNKMTIPDNRIEAAQWVFQFSIFTFMIKMFTIPYNAAIIAHERMNVYAYVSIVEVILKLVIVYLLVIFMFDKLVLYAILTFAVTAIVTFIYRIYCKRKFEECVYRFYWDKKLFKEIVGFSGWNVLGNMSLVLKNQGNNILLNIFFGPVVNAANGIALQVNNALNAFVVNFQMALNPPITKSYAANDNESALNFVFQGARFSFFLLYLVSLPILLRADFILGLWLKNIPEYSILFVRLVLIISLTDTLYRTLVTLHLATGNIRTLQIVVGGMNLLILPVSYVFLKLGAEPEITLIIAFIFSLVSLYIRIFLLKKVFPISIISYSKEVILNVSKVVLLSLPIPVMGTIYLDNSFLGFVATTLLSVLSCIICVFFGGLSKSERIWVKEKLNVFINRFRNAR